MRTRVTVVSLSVCLFVCLFVCLLPVYWLFKRLTQWNEHTSRFFAKRWRFSTKGFLWNAFFQELQPLSLVLQFQVSHFVSILTNARRIRLHTHAVLHISYIEHTYPAAASFDPASLCGSDCRLTPFRTRVGTTFMLPFSENVLCIDTKEPFLLLYVAILF